MSALLDEFRSVLNTVRTGIASQVNSGLVVSIDQHLAELAAAAQHGEQYAEDRVHEIVSALYTAFHAPAADETPSTAAPAAPEPEPALATGGTVETAPVIVGESGPETVAMPTAAAVVPESPAPSTSGTLGEHTEPEPAAAEQPAEPAAAEPDAESAA